MIDDDVPHPPDTQQGRRTNCGPGKGDRNLGGKASGRSADYPMKRRITGWF